MRLKWKPACVGGTGALVAALGGLGGTSAQGAAVAAPVAAAIQRAVPTAPAVQRAVPTAPAIQRAAVTVHPDIRHVGHVEKQPPTTAECEAAFTVACYEPSQIEQAYNLWPLYRTGVGGQGTTIVIVDSWGSPTIREDLDTFDKTFGLPAPSSFKIIQPAGAVHFDPNSADELGWASETSLDVEYAHTIAPYANLLLVETPVSETEGAAGFAQIMQAENYVISHYPADVISQSFGATEETFPDKDSVQALRGAYFAALRHHVTVLAASGDGGAADVGPDGQTFYLSPVTSWPASDPLVTGVGGTQLHLNASGNHVSADTVWNDTGSAATNQFIFGNKGPNPLASGGGTSELFGRPYYQDDVADEVGDGRGVPDISMSAACNGAVDVYMSLPWPGWYPTCGTSEATPLFAGIVALADQVAQQPLGLINPALYRIYKHNLPGIVDITSGNNTVSFFQNGQLQTVQGFSAWDEYSTVCGVGTVNGALFVPELARYARYAQFSRY